MRACFISSASPNMEIYTSHSVAVFPACEETTHDHTEDTQIVESSTFLPFSRVYTIRTAKRNHPKYTAGLDPLNSQRIFANFDGQTAGTENLWYPLVKAEGLEHCPSLAGRLLTQASHNGVAGGGEKRRISSAMPDPSVL